MGNAGNVSRDWGRRSASERKRMLTDILAQVSSEALQGDSLEAVLKRIVDRIMLRLPVTIASIILLNASNTHFVQEVWASDLNLELPTELPWPVDLGAAGRCARTGEPQLIADVKGDPDYVPGNSDVRSEYLVPIRHRDRIHGVLNLESTDADFFNAEVREAFDAIARQIAGAVHLATVVRELEVANRKLRQLSMSDGLTGIANRRCFDDFFAEEWERHAELGHSLALLLIDVDCFKLLNDAHGHLYGDECLRDLASHCDSLLGSDDGLVARFGGEEFATLLTNCGLRDARRFGERMRRGVEALALPHRSSHVAGHVTVSIGVSAVVPCANRAAEVLLATSDHALYRAKNSGRNRVVARSVPPLLMRMDGRRQSPGDRRSGKRSLQ